MRFEERLDETKYRDAYRALRELQVALRAIAARSEATNRAADLERIAGHHLGTIERLIESEHHAYLLTAPAPRMVFTDEDQRDPKLREALAGLRRELGPEPPADPTGVDSHERHESPEDQA